jgi:hypothetical protein
MDGKPQARAWFVDAPVDPADPLAGVKARAKQLCDPFRHVGAIDAAAELFADECFDPSETYDAAEAAGLPPGLADAAAYIGLTLRRIELDG